MRMTSIYKKNIHENIHETLMRPLGKAMKIAHMNKHSEKDTPEQLLDNYRDTPHSATGLTPSAMLFRDDKQTSFPRQPVTERDIEIAREHDEQRKRGQNKSMAQSIEKKTL